MKKTVIIALFLLLLQIPAFAVEYPFTHWFNVYIQDVKVGYSYDILERSVYEGAECLKETTYMKLDISRGEAKIQAESKSTIYVKEDLTPIYFKVDERSGLQDLTVEGEINGGKIKIKSTLAGSTQEKELPYIKGVLLEESVNDYLRRGGYKTGDEFSVKIFSKDTMNIQDIKITVKGEQKEGGTDVYVVDTEFAGMTATHYIDKKGFTLRSDVPALGATMVKTTETDALKAGTGNLDVLDSFTVTSNMTIDDPRRVRSMSLKMHFEDGIPKALTDKTDKNIEVVPEAKNIIYRLKKEEFDADKAVNIPVTGKKYIKYQMPTIYEQSNDRGIIDSAVNIVGDEKNSFKAAGKIVNWVYKAMKKKDYSVAFNSAKETLASREGDCTEHSVLAVALCRAAGIPARVCAGLVAYKDKFQYHMWIEVNTGEWVAMDPTFNEVSLDGAHIKFGDGVLDEEGRYNLILEIINYFRKIKIEVFEIKYD